MYMTQKRMIQEIKLNLTREQNSRIYLKTGYAHHAVQGKIRFINSTEATTI